MDINVSKLKALEDWEYTEDWLNRNYGKTSEKDKIKNILLTWEASYKVRNYIFENGPTLMACQRHINRFIDIIGSPEFDKLRHYDLILQFIKRFNVDSFADFLNSAEDDMDKLHAYNYNNLPIELVNIIESIHSMRCQTKTIFDCVLKELNQRAEILAHFERRQMEQENQQKQIELRNRHMHGQAQVKTKWDSIELEHSKIENGIVYVLTNDLMPGLVKIGFTQGNPVNRAKRLDEQYNLPSKFQVAGYCRTKDPYIIEALVHRELAEYKVSGEFYRVPPERALEEIKRYANKNIYINTKTDQNKNEIEDKNNDGHISSEAPQTILSDKELSELRHLYSSFKFWMWSSKKTKSKMHDHQNSKIKPKENRPSPYSVTPKPPVERAYKPISRADVANRVEDKTICLSETPQTPLPTIVKIHKTQSYGQPLVKPPLISTVIYCIMILVLLYNLSMLAI